jgi:glycosyltransferase involved in cell wall biosynthesis
LFFYSLISKKSKVHKYDIIQGTTYTTLAFLGNGIPTVSLFGSTTFGFLKNVPSLERIKREDDNLVRIFNGLKKYSIVERLVPLVKSSKDLSKIEIDVAKKTDLVIATSKIVKQELIRNGVPRKKIALIHNAIEDFWFKSSLQKKIKPISELVYLGRMGDDLFTIKLKGIDRFIYILKELPNLRKTIIGLCQKADKYHQFFSQFLKTTSYLSVDKRKIPKILRNHYGDLYINTGRYEGFCLSLIEAMSQGLVPITFPIGVAPEIIQDGRNGYLVHTMDDMIRKIRFLSSKKATRARMAEEAITTSRLFNSDVLIKKYTDIYQKLQNKKGSLEP